MSRYSLSVDGVGLWTLAPGPTWSIGGPGSGADLELLASLPSRAAELTFRDGEYRWTQEGDDRPAPLRDSQEIPLRGGSRLEFLRPHPWSYAATLKPVGARPADGSDGLILWTGPCVLGPETDSHVVCRDWAEAVTLFRWDDGPRWRLLDAAGPQPVNRMHDETLIETETARVLVSHVENRLRNTAGHTAG